ncbi:MAG: hypothetical protein EOP45_21190 [Sphingobacteriaceae bacterium]|nr:MAG: hypothetical protein EOP45_21190 [Sphingobacteriaceae bacterium]
MQGDSYTITITGATTAQKVLINNLIEMSKSKKCSNVFVQIISDKDEASKLQTKEPKPSHKIVFGFDSAKENDQFFCYISERAEVILYKVVLKLT